MSRNVIETAVADVQLNDEGAPSQVNGYRMLRQLGEGTFSKVFHCQDGAGHEYALKCLNKSFLKRKREYKKVDGKMVFSNAFQKVQKEVAIMKKLAHPSLVKLHEIIDSPVDDKMFLVLELITGGQVMKWDDKAFRYRSLRHTAGVLAPDDVRDCMRDVVHGLEYLHKNCVCHRDIKPENILLASSHEYKLADFGVAHMVDDAGKKTLRNTEGTYHFLAPECTTGEEYDPYQVDIWALGVTMFALLFGTLPFGTKAASLTDVMTSIREDPLVVPALLEAQGNALNADCEQMLRLMLVKEPSQRISIVQLKMHPWIADRHDTARRLGLNDLASADDDGEDERGPALVEVTKEEIENAFTPVNNFILMARLKVRMAGRLARARNSIDLAKGNSPIAGAAELRSRAESMASADVLKRLERTDGLGDAVIALPALESPVKSEAQHASDTEPIPNSSIGAKTLTQRRSVNISSDMSTQRDDVLTEELLAGSEYTELPSPVRQPHASPVARRKSTLQRDLIVDDDATAAISDAGAVSPAVSPTNEATPVFVRAPSHLSPLGRSTRRDLHLPRLDIPLMSSGASSPSMSPATSPIVSHRPMSPRSPRVPGPASPESPATFVLPPAGEDVSGNSAQDSSPVVRKSPTERRRLSGSFHIGTVHPEPSSARDVVTLDGHDADACAASSPQQLMSPNAVAPSAGRRSKSQEETKAAIAGILTRTSSGMDPVSSATSPMREPSVMLQRRKSSNAHDCTTSSGTTPPKLVRTLSTSSDQQQQQGRHRLPSTCEGLDTDVAVPSSIGDSNYPPVRRRNSALASLIDTEPATEPDTPPQPGRVVDDDESGGGNVGDTAKGVQHTARASGSNQGSPTARTSSQARISMVAPNLGDCLPPPEHTELYYVDATTHAVHKYTGGEDARDVLGGPALGDLPMTPMPSSAHHSGRGDETRTRTTLMGLFRKASNITPATDATDSPASSTSRTCSRKAIKRGSSRRLLSSKRPSAAHSAATEKQSPPQSPPDSHAQGQVHHDVSALVHPTSIQGGVDATADTTHPRQLEDVPGSIRRMLFTNRSMLDSQDSIRVLLLRRGSSVKSLMSGAAKNSGGDDAANGTDRQPTLAALRDKRSKSMAATNQRATTPKTAVCSIM